MGLEKGYQEVMKCGVWYSISVWMHLNKVKPRLGGKILYLHPTFKSLIKYQHKIFGKKKKISRIFNHIVLTLKPHNNVLVKIKMCTIYHIHLTCIIKTNKMFKTCTVTVPYPKDLESILLGYKENRYNKAVWHRPLLCTQDFSTPVIPWLVLC